MKIPRSYLPVNFSLDSRLMDYDTLEEKRIDTEKLLRALNWKSNLLDDFPLILCLMGGTGTGKSTLFNSLAGRKISEVGVRRPCTVKAIVLAHEEAAQELSDCPCFEEQGERNATVFFHDCEELKHIILVDTPDFDSVEISNRLIADNFFMISDILILITSQEKYGDMVGRDVMERARSWGKKTIFVMNKAISDEAYNNFRSSLRVWGNEIQTCRVGRMEPSPDYISGLRDRPEFSELFQVDARKGVWEKIRSKECGRLLDRSIESHEDLEKSILVQTDRILSVNTQIQSILSSVSEEMESRLEEILSSDLEIRIRNRLQRLLRKYDILFVPRMMVRNAVRKIFREFQNFFVSVSGNVLDTTDEKKILVQDFEATLSAAKLLPLEVALSKFNFETAELLSSNPALEDLRKVAGNNVPRWNSEKIRSMYEQSFPGLEFLLESEIDRFRKGLSSFEEFKLYGSYTLWALLLITVEIAVGGGFTLLDALLNTVIVPFIPPWLLKLKVIDLLKEIGERVDLENRKTLRAILEQQAELYTREFSSLIPSEMVVQEIRATRESLLEAKKIEVECFCRKQFLDDSVIK